ncbi:hypothetical protein CON01_14980 [Bacillus thuringiensis]|uniref:Uncharacterized protein n=1 Tax=Bacillus thuringiensis TaxID=1428 RepID=A0A9X6TZK0_BACTU|nr:MULTISPECIES: hypothetical protein [Bacillus cereus group]EKS8377718.1 hypothetical protein [Bacillus cereus]EKS8383556.1 hypothetical protein [Bacillus cereus]PED13688.1 hypothetical protein CON01_14980 [Bacillus thuringiensis]PFC04850.1 hypothetical protein CN302_03815 [Bacillus thuringiensis]PFF54971.1 hypothetical protein CN350_22840 [Bacillus cereus]
MIDTEKMSEFLQTAERLNNSLMEINEVIEAIDDTSNVLKVSLFHKKFNENLLVSESESIGEKSIDFAIRPTVLACLRDQKKFLESELQNLLSKQLEGGNE